MISRSCLSVFKYAKKSNVAIDPFPFIVIENVLDEDLYELLKNDYPEDNDIIRAYVGDTKPEQNTRYQMDAKQILCEKEYDKKVCPLWKEFVRYHTSQEFLKEVHDLFGDHIYKLYPWLKKDYNTLNKINHGVRWTNKNKYDFVLDCQPGINSRVDRPSTVIGPHLDNKVELYAGLLYMRDDNDKSEGGDLEVYRHKTGNVRFVSRRDVDTKMLVKTHTVNYSRNTLVFFINSKLSIHGVSDRSVTKTSRKLVNIIGEMYKLPKGYNFHG